MPPPVNYVFEKFVFNNNIMM